MRDRNPDKYYLYCAFIFSQLYNNDYTREDLQKAIEDKIKEGVLVDIGYSGAGHLCVYIEFNTAAEAEPHIQTCRDIASAFNTWITNLEINRTIERQ